jgi:hypothetical protein
MKKYGRESVLVLFVLVFLAPVIFYHSPLYYFSPDIQYVKAKVLRVTEGDLFADPVTGFPTFHPPFYHLFLSIFSGIGLGIDTLLFMVTVFNVLLLFLFSFLILKEVLDEKTAFWTTLLIPFLFQNLGPGQIFLATAFYFSIPFYLAGLWLYMKQPASPRKAIIAALLWGLAFLISPVYFFLIGFTFLHELIFKRNYRRFIILVTVFLFTIIPFIYQAYFIRSSSMAGTGAFALWRDIPDLEWLKTFFTYLLSPVENNPFGWPVIPTLAVAAAGLIGYIKSKHKSPFVPIAALAYLFTAYHFISHYAPRIEFFPALLLTGYGIRFLHEARIKKGITIAAILVFSAIGLAPHLLHNVELYSNQSDDFPDYRQVADGLHSNLGRYIDPDGFVLASDKTYRNFILPKFPAHGLVAYKSGEYFQLNAKISREMLDDYNELMGSDNIKVIEHFCRKYNMRIAVIGEAAEVNFPAFRTIAKKWEIVYHDPYFAVYRKP